MAVRRNRPLSGPSEPDLSESPGFDNPQSGNEADYNRDESQRDENSKRNPDDGLRLDVVEVAHYAKVNSIEQEKGTEADQRQGGWLPTKTCSSRSGSFRGRPCRNPITRLRHIPSASEDGKCSLVDGRHETRRIPARAGAESPVRKDATGRFGGGRGRNLTSERRSFLAAAKAYLEDVRPYYRLLTLEQMRRDLSVLTATSAL